MRTMTVETGTYRTDVLFATCCPYLDSKSSVCGASITGIELEPVKKEKLCSTDSSWDCPMLLSKILRRP